MVEDRRDVKAVEFRPQCFKGHNLLLSSQSMFLSVESMGEIYQDVDLLAHPNLTLPYVEDVSKS